MNMPEPVPLPTSTELPSDAKCQEASILSRNFYIGCYKPATHIVETDGQFWPMCRGCAWHNVKNRRAILHYGEL